MALSGRPQQHLVRFCHIRTYYYYTVTILLSAYTLNVCCVYFVRSMLACDRLPCTYLVGSSDVRPYAWPVSIDLWPWLTADGVDTHPMIGKLTSWSMHKAGQTLHDSECAYVDDLELRKTKVRNGLKVNKRALLLFLEVSSLQQLYY